MANEGLRLLGVLAIASHRDRILYKDRLVRDDVIEVLAVLLRGDDLVLIGDQDVPLATGKGLKRLAGTPVLYRNVAEELPQVFDPLILRSALL